MRKGEKEAEGVRKSEKEAEIKGETGSQFKVMERWCLIRLAFPSTTGRRYGMKE